MGVTAVFQETECGSESGVEFLLHGRRDIQQNAGVDRQIGDLLEAPGLLGLAILEDLEVVQLETHDGVLLLVQDRDEELDELDFQVLHVVRSIHPDSVLDEIAVGLVSNDSDVGQLAVAVEQYGLRPGRLKESGLEGLVEIELDFVHHTTFGDIDPGLGA